MAPLVERGSIWSKTSLRGVPLLYSRFCVVSAAEMTLPRVGIFPWVRRRRSHPSVLLAPPAFRLAPLAARTQASELLDEPVS